MKIAGIIAEYNPFHNGHEYQIRKTKEITGADKVIVCMSGNFLQRGEPAFLDKFIRTRLALLGGADFVLELPVKYSTASAENFALGGVSILESLGCVDYLSFGCENPNEQLFDKVASVLANEPPLYREVLDKELRLGKSFPEARQSGVKVCLMEEAGVIKEAAEEELNNMLSEPNNTLALEYYKALKKTCSHIKPVAIKREGAGYNQELDKTCKQNDMIYPSAMGIRKLITDSDYATGLEDKLKGLIPDSCLGELMECMKDNQPVCIDDYSQLIKYKIKQELSRGESLQKYEDVSEEIENRIINSIDKMGKASDFIQEIKTRQYTYTRISRCLIHILLDVKNEEYLPEEDAYCRILGFRKDASWLVKQVTESAKLPVVAKPSAAKNMLEGKAKATFYQDVAAGELYHIIFQNEYNEYKTNMVII